MSSVPNSRSLEIAQSLRQIADEVSLLPSVDDPDISALGVAARLVAIRNLRSSLLPAASFADPGWYMLLDLYLWGNRKVRVSSLCIASGAPASTALRHLYALVQVGYLAIDGDEEDGRCRLVTLTPQAKDAMAVILGAGAREKLA